MLLFDLKLLLLRLPMLALSRWRTAQTAFRFAVAAALCTAPATRAVAQGSCSASGICSEPITRNMAFVSRAVDKKVLSREQGEGAGARVRRSIGNAALRNFDPFLMLDEFRVPLTAGFPDHPHRGFETVTFMLDGQFEHEDFAGHAGTIGPGDLQWMTAGKGIVHAEMPHPESDAEPHGLQLWINLGSKDKMVPPKYQELKNEDIPKVEKDGVWVAVIAGEALGTKSPVYTVTPSCYLHFKIQPQSRIEQAIPPEFNAFVYTLKGKLKIGDKGTEIDAHHTATLTRDASANGVVLANEGEEVAEFVLIGGEPHNEPIEQYGPFVMNTREEIMKAFTDYQSGRNGFERAPTFQSKIGRRMY